MKLPVFGRVADPNALDLEPIEAPVVGYTLDKQEVLQVVRFRPMSPTWGALEMARHTDAEGNVPTATAIDFLESCVLAEDSDTWRTFLQRPDVFIEESTVLDLYRAVLEVYGNRPTQRSSDSASGASQPGATSTDAAPSLGSTSEQPIST